MCYAYRMDYPKSTPKDFFLWAGAMITLYAGVFSFVSLVFDYINYTFPDPLSYFPADPYQSGISYEMASLIVLAPVFLILMRVIRRDIIAHAEKKEIWVRRWALVLVLFVAGATIVGDLIVLLTTFLNGEELSVRFLLKILVVLLVASAGFMHFLADLWSYWDRFPARARAINYATAILVILTVVAGFFIVGTPGQAREYRFDEQKISDLQNIQYQVVYYWQRKQVLPATLADLNDSLSSYTIPTDSQSGKAYAYEATGPLAFKLCADFNRDSRAVRQGERGINMYLPSASPVYGGKGGTEDNWSHGAGTVCFERTIDPALYPPTTPQK